MEISHHQTVSVSRFKPILYLAIVYCIVHFLKGYYVVHIAYNSSSF